MSEAKHSPLLPCPFCGSSRIEDLEHLDWVCCQDCGASLEDVEPSARALWNTRDATSLRHELVAALAAMINEHDSNVCEHETTHRGGSIWTICDGCGQKWADDRGGFKPYCDPAEVVVARVVLQKAKQGDKQ